MADLMKLCKQSLSVNESSTIKDDEIINVLKNDALITEAIVMYVKANFGNTEIKEKELSARNYALLCNNLSLSQSYKEVNSNGCTRNLPN